MEISERESGDIVIYDFSGMVSIGQGDVLIRDTVLNALASGHRKILLNLGKVESIDSAGVGELLSANAAVKNRGGQFKITNLSPKVGAVFKVTQLIGILEVFEDEETALASFEQGGAAP